MPAPNKSGSVNPTAGWNVEVLMEGLDELYIDVDVTVNVAAQMRWLDRNGRVVGDTVSLPVGSHSWSDWASKDYHGVQLSGAGSLVRYQVYGKVG